MFRGALWLLLLVGYVAMVWHGVTGDNGPMGWLNALQQHWTGGYSRKLSFLVFCFGSVVLSSPVLLPLVLISPGTPSSAMAPAEAVTAPVARPISGWKTAALAWIVPMALAWSATLVYYAWDWHVRGQDAVQRYEPVSLAGGTTPTPISSGAHLALQGRFLWDRMVVRRERNQPELTYVPIVARGWREGEPVRFIAHFESREVAAWRTGDETRRDPILARADGVAPTAAVDVFAKAGTPLAPSAALVVTIAAVAGMPAQPQPAFDLANALLLGSVLTGVWTLCALAIALAFAKNAWSARRRARRAAQGISDGPRTRVWIGRRLHRRQATGQRRDAGESRGPG